MGRIITTMFVRYQETIKQHKLKNLLSIWRRLAKKMKVVRTIKQQLRWQCVWKLVATYPSLDAETTK